MNNKVKIAIAVLILIAILSFILMSLTIKQLRKENSIKNVELLTMRDSAEVYRTKAGEAYFKIKSATIESNALKESLSAMGIENRDLRQRNIKKDDIISTLKAELAVAGNGVMILYDTLYFEKGAEMKYRKFDWNNDHLIMNGIVKEKTIEMNYFYKTSVTLVTESNRKESKVTAFLDDPNATITTGSSIVIKNRTPWYRKPWLWGLGGLVGGYLIAK